MMKNEILFCLFKFLSLFFFLTRHLLHTSSPLLFHFFFWFSYNNFWLKKGSFFFLCKIIFAKFALFLFCFSDKVKQIGNWTFEFWKVFLFPRTLWEFCTRTKQTFYDNKFIVFSAFFFSTEANQVNEVMKTKIILNFHFFFVFFQKLCFLCDWNVHLFLLSLLVNFHFVSVVQNFLFIFFLSFQFQKLISSNFYRQNSHPTKSVFFKNYFVIQKKFKLVELPFSLNH